MVAPPCPGPLYGPAGCSTAAAASVPYFRSRQVVEAAWEPRLHVGRPLAPACVYQLQGQVVEYQNVERMEGSVHHTRLDPELSVALLSGPLSNVVAIRDLSPPAVGVGAKG